MLGRLFSAAASSLQQSEPSSPSTRSRTSPESVQEEAHTHSLLYPDPSLLHQPQSYAFPLPNPSFAQTSAAVDGYDCYGELDLQNPQDIRVLVAQDSTASQPDKTVLLDSKSPKGGISRTSKENSRGHGAKTHTPRTSLSSIVRPTSSESDVLSSTASNQPGMSMPRNAAPPCIGGIDGGSVFQRSQRRAQSVTAETYQGRFATQQRNELRTILDCMFGSAPLSYKGPSIKLHVMPMEPKTPSRLTNPSPLTMDESGSSERAEGRRRSQLAQSFTPGNFSSDTGSSDQLNPGDPTCTSNRRSILVTRMFSVNLPELNNGVQENVGGSPSPPVAQSHTKSYPFPRMAGENGNHGPSDGKKSVLKQMKTPMFAVALVFSLPVASPKHIASQSGPSSYPGSRMASSFQSIAEFPSSLDDEVRASAIFNASGFDGLSSLTPTGDIDDGMDIIVQHWEAISRILASLQTLAHGEILKALSSVYVAIPRTLVQAPPATQLQASRKPLKMNQQTIQLKADALSQSKLLRQGVDRIGQRAILELRIPRVVTGQGRWGIWRDEARWLSKWATGKEQNFFFFNILTAFLGTHTEWLGVLAPKPYRKRYRQVQKALANEEHPLSSRTVIVSGDKMAARRFIFLLSAFLPAGNTSFESISPRRPATATSVGEYSQSPPLGHFHKKESLRRSINRRAKQNRIHPQGHLRTTSFPTHHVEESMQEEGLHKNRESRHSRRSSGSSSKAASANMTIPLGSPVPRKSSTATTATVTPATTMPHFVAPHIRDRRDMSSEHRRGSSSSLASMNLITSLQRNDSNNLSNHGSESNPNSRWGSLLSGFWSRGDSSTDASEPFNGAEDALGARPEYTTHAENRSSGKLDQMVSEAESFREVVSGLDTKRPDTHVNKIPSEGKLSEALGNRTSISATRTTVAQAIPVGTSRQDSPLKVSVDERDGVVDVDVGMGSLMSSSFGSPVSSTGSHGLASFVTQDNSRYKSGFQASSCPFTNVGCETEVSVAGWLKRFHPDFALQAVSPYQELETDVKEAMRSEPTPATFHHYNNQHTTSGNWVDICSALLADADKFTIKRLRLRRRVRRGAQNFASSDTPASEPPPDENPYISQPLTPHLDLGTTSMEEEQFIIEPIFNMDHALVEAIERVLATAGNNTRPPSSASTRPSSCRRGRAIERELGAPDQSTKEISNGQLARGECKTTVLSALECIIRTVFAEDSVDRNVRAKESTLREGIRKWLEDLEDYPI
ncbi:MAG: hypothetical protein M1824_001767 [Vezdaea acicularis]|nr:MAG: hypothetical protein M1824_001767 [Vezdaea acicularis]